MVLLVVKFAAGIFGHSAAMIADAVHSLTDFATDVVVLIFVHLGNKPADRDHDYGHGKYETLATAIIGTSLLAVGVLIFCSGAGKTWRVIQGEMLPSPGKVALVAAVASIVLKEWAYRFTVKVGKRCQSEAVVANAWHHRSDALSSVGTMIGVGGAILLGNRWTVLDPLASIVVSVFIVRAAWQLMMESMKELTEASLSDEDEAVITHIAASEPGAQSAHTTCGQPHSHRDARPHAGFHTACRSTPACHCHRASAQGALRSRYPRKHPSGACQGEECVCVKGQKVD